VKIKSVNIVLNCPGKINSPAILFSWVIVAIHVDVRKTVNTLILFWPPYSSFKQGFMRRSFQRPDIITTAKTLHMSIHHSQGSKLRPAGGVFAPRCYLFVPKKLLMKIHYR
jgi:hypothetical protein